MNQVIDGTKTFLVEGGQKKVEEMREKQRLTCLWFLGTFILIALRLGLYLLLIEGREIYPYDLPTALCALGFGMTGSYFLRQARQIKADPDVQKYLELRRREQKEEYEAKYG